MQRDLRAYLYDIQRAAESIDLFTVGLSFETYESDARTRLAVERCFEIIGEALVQAARNVEDIEAVVPHARRMIAFRNLLIHNYSIIDNRQVWRAVQDAQALALSMRTKLEEKS